MLRFQVHIRTHSLSRAGDWTQSLGHSKQALYHLRYILGLLSDSVSSLQMLHGSAGSRLQGTVTKQVEPGSTFANIEDPPPLRTLSTSVSYSALSSCSQDQALGWVFCPCRYRLFFDGLSFFPTLVMPKHRSSYWSKRSEWQPTLRNVSFSESPDTAHRIVSLNTSTLTQISQKGDNG